MSLAIVSLPYSRVFCSGIPEDSHKKQVQCLSSCLYPRVCLEQFLIPAEPDFVNKHQFFLFMAQVGSGLCLSYLTAAAQGQGSGWEHKGGVPGYGESSRNGLLQCDRMERGRNEVSRCELLPLVPVFILSFQTHHHPKSTPFPFPPVC